MRPERAKGQRPGSAETRQYWKYAVSSVQKPSGHSAVVVVVQWRVVLRAVMLQFGVRWA